RCLENPEWDIVSAQQIQNLIVGIELMQNDSDVGSGGAIRFTGFGGKVQDRPNLLPGRPGIGIAAVEAPLQMFVQRQKQVGMESRGLCNSQRVVVGGKRSRLFLIIPRKCIERRLRVLCSLLDSN